MPIRIMNFDIGEGTVVNATEGNLYFADPDTDGTWRIVMDNNNLSFQRRESGNYIEKGATTP